MTKEEMAKILAENNIIMQKLQNQCEQQNEIINSITTLKKSESSFAFDFNKSMNQAIQQSISSLIIDSLRSNRYDSAGTHLDKIIKTVINENQETLLSLTREAYNVALTEANALKQTLKEEIKNKICKNISSEIVSSMVDKTMVSQFKNNPEFRAKLSLVISDFINNYELTEKNL
jgi:hypothetical protein